MALNNFAIALGTLGGPVCPEELGLRATAWALVSQMGKLKLAFCSKTLLVILWAFVFRFLFGQRGSEILTKIFNGCWELEQKGGLRKPNIGVERSNNPENHENRCLSTSAKSFF